MKYSTVLSSLLSIVGAGKSSASLSENDNSALILQTMRPNPEPYSITYEDGTESPLLFIKIRGDEDRVKGNDEAPLVYEETIDGFTVQPSAAQGGKYTYFDIDVETGDLIDTGLVAGEANPELMKVHKHAATMSENFKVPNIAHPDFRDDHHSRNLRGSKLSVDEDVNPHHRRTEITSGVMNNLVVPIRFSDHTTRVLPSRGDLEVLMNNNGAATQCPTGSVRDVFKQSSFGKLDLQSTVVDWITIDYTEAQCANGNSGLTTFIHTCLTNALDKLRDDGFNFGGLDEDNDGFIDGMTFFHSGYAAEWGGNDEDGTSYINRIWSHKWAIYTQNWSSDGVRIFNYHINPSLWARSGSSIGRIGVVAHETGHFLGLPDLYDYGDRTYGDGEGIGSWGLMANSWGFDFSQYYPPLMSAWSKMDLGWVTPTVASTSGTYSLGQACDNDEIIMISKGYPSGEYILIENRQPCGFESRMPQGGLAIFHIDNNANNIRGYPGQSGWPTNQNHYKVAILQADGSYGLEKNFNRGDSGDLFHAGGVNSIGPDGTSTSPYPNTKAYQGGIILDTEVTISNIGAAGARMTFDVTFGTDEVTNIPTSSPTALPTVSRTSSPTALPTVSRTSSPTALPTVSRTSSPTADTSQNVALGKPTTQSTTAHGGSSSRAVDGNRSGTWSRGSVTHTTKMTNPSWSVDLSAVYAISQINVFNRVDCCTDRLSGFKVIIWEEGAEAWSYTHPGGTPPRENMLTVPPNVSGHKVEVMIPGTNKILSLAEVEVFGEYIRPLPLTSSPTAAPTMLNVALGKPTTQSTTAHGGSSSRAVDGNRSGTWSRGSVTHTSKMTNPYWTVSLLATYEINSIVVFNRVDCCTDRLSGFKVIIWNGDVEAWSYTHPGGTPERKSSINVPSITGDKVEVMIPGTNKILSLAEVLVFAN